MNKTTNYQLNQWERTDKVQMEDFNADNAKIDAAIRAVDAKADGKADASEVAEIAANQLRLVTGSYKGTGEYGWEHPNTLTFPFPPIIVGIVTNRRDIGEQGTLLIRGQTESGGIGGSSNGALYLGVSWEGNSVSWSTSLSYVQDQLNLADTTYFYFALG